VKRWRIKAVSPTDGVTFVDWTTDASDSQAALKQFLEMLDGTLGPNYYLDGDWNLQVREIEGVTQSPPFRKFPRAV